MTERLYYTNSFLHDFEAGVRQVQFGDNKLHVILDRSAFYPTSGGQDFDTGWLEFSTVAGTPVRVSVHQVFEDEQSGDVVHVVDSAAGLVPGMHVRGTVDSSRRRDHMQQHSGQHVLSAAFEKLYGFRTVSFHMGDASCTIDLDTPVLDPGQLEAAEVLANEVIAEDRPVEVRFATREAAVEMGVRKIPTTERDKLRLIDMGGFDLNACGGTHVRSTGQIGSILLRKIEKVKQGTRVEFVCGLRAVRTARRDFVSLMEAAGLFSTHVWDVPEQARKLIEEVKSSQKALKAMREEVAEWHAARLFAIAEERPAGSAQKLLVHYFPDRDLEYVKLMAQKITRMGNIVVLFGAGDGSPALVFAQTPGLGNDMGSLMKQTVKRLGTRGGGTRDLAQGGAPSTAVVEQALLQAVSQIG